MRASAPIGDGNPGRLPVYRTEAAMVTQHRWTLSAARGTVLDAWLRRNGAEEKQRKAALHAWENEGGANELPSRSDLGQTRTAVPVIDTTGSR